MREVLYRKKRSLKYRRKVVSICEKNEDKECKTYVRKNFVYAVAQVRHELTTLPPADIFIRKEYDSKNREEKFTFRVKGAFYTVRGRHYLKVDFSHSLHIHIFWKSKDFSPKSVTLT